MAGEQRDVTPDEALIHSWLGDYGFGEPDDQDEDPLGRDLEYRPGESSVVHVDDPATRARARRFRDVLGRFSSGVTVVTGTDAGVPVGLTCQSFTSVSLDPPLVLFCVARTSRAWPRIWRAGSFSVNVLAEDQAAVSDVMASRGVDKFAGLAWRPSAVTGSPRIDGATAYVDCSIHAVHEAGDHFVVIGRVLDLAAGEAEHALTFHRGRYGSTRTE